MVQLVKNSPAMWETWVRSLGWGDPLEMGMQTHSNILAWRIPWTEESGRLQSVGLQSLSCYMYQESEKLFGCDFFPCCITLSLTPELAL